MRHHHADIALELALDADAVRRRHRPASGEKGGDDLEKLTLVDRAAAQLEIDRHVIGDRGRGRERVDIVGPRIDDGRVFLHIREVAQRLDAAGGRAGADGDERARALAHFADALGIVRRGDRAFDQREIVAPFDGAAGRLGKIGDLDRAGDGEQFVLAVEQAELAAVARGEFPDGEPRLALLRRHVRSPSAQAGLRTRS